MSLYQYEQSKALTAGDPSFYAIIMAAMRKADDANLALLKAAFPDQWVELLARYNAPGGKLEGE